MTTDAGERELIALVRNEQSSFRFIMIAGLLTLVVLVGMSVALGFYYYDVSQKLTKTAFELQREAFNTRRTLDNQVNRGATQEQRLRRIQFELRRMTAGAAGAAGAPTEADALSSARDYLQYGRLSLSDERTISAAAGGGGGGGGGAGRGASAPPPATPTQALLRGVNALVSWNRDSNTIPSGGQGLPRNLERARTNFATAAAADATLTPLARTGEAWIAFIYAGSDRSNYAAADCQTLFQAIAQSASGASPGPQPLYWRAQCERKIGRTLDALRDYAHALEESMANGEPSSYQYAELTLAMNAFHGVGTTLVAAQRTPDSNAVVSEALTVARRLCHPSPDATGSPRMRIAGACLQAAIELRRRLLQTPNQVSGSGENVSFVYLRDGNFAEAFRNAQEVSRTGLFAWNELVRALAAKHVPESEAAEEAGAQAERNVSFFDVGQFNLCELRALLSNALYAEAVGIVRATHPGEAVACAAA